MLCTLMLFQIQFIIQIYPKHTQHTHYTRAGVPWYALLDIIYCVSPSHNTPRFKRRCIYCRATIQLELNQIVLNTDGGKNVLSAPMLFVTLLCSVNGKNKCTLRIFTILIINVMNMVGCCPCSLYLATFFRKMISASTFGTKLPQC